MGNARVLCFKKTITAMKEKMNKWLESENEAYGKLIGMEHVKNEHIVAAAIGYALFVVSVGIGAMIG